MSRARETSDRRPAPRPQVAASASTGGFRRLLAAFGGVLALLTVPLGLSGPTAWLLIPAHLAWSAVVCLGATIEGFAGHPERARWWGLAYLIVTALGIATLELGAQARETWAWYWGPPWLLMMLWGWIPPVAAGLAGVLGEQRQRRLTGRALRRRRAT